MTVTGRLAFANVRARCRAAGLLGPEVAAHLSALRDPAARAAALRKLGAAGDATELRRARLARLLFDYAVLAESYPVGKELLAALARLHEIENLKLLHRAARRGVPAQGLEASWRSLRGLRTLRRADADQVQSLRDLEAATAATPYAGIARASLLASLEPVSAELAFDRFGSRRLVEEARRLPRAHAGAAALVLDLVRERDLDTIRRAAAYGIAPELAAAGAALLGEEKGWERLAELAAWTPAEGPLGMLLPRRFLRSEALVADWDALEHALRRRRRRACAAAFIGAPFRLDPGVAYLLLAEEEIRGLGALAEAAGDPLQSGVVARALAGSALGD